MRLGLSELLPGRAQRKLAFHHFIGKVLQTAASFCHFHQPAPFVCPLRRCKEEEEEDGRKEKVKD